MLEYVHIGDDNRHSRYCNESGDIAFMPSLGIGEFPRYYTLVDIAKKRLCFNHKYPMYGLHPRFIELFKEIGIEC